MFKTPKTNCEFQIFSKDTNDNVVQFIYSPENQFIHLQTMNSDFFMKRKKKVINLLSILITNHINNMN